jgi:hypothetical protein
MTRADHLEILKLLSALESWAYAEGKRLPDFLQERLCESIDKLTVEVLKDV